MQQAAYFETTIGDLITNGLLNVPWRSDSDQLALRLSNLDGGKRSAYVLWLGPEGASDIGDVNKNAYRVTFLQAAGTKDRMTLEWKTNRDGAFRQYALGHGGPREGEPRETVEFNHGETGVMVFPDELFEHEEAARIFVHYLQHDAPPAEYVFRDLGLKFTDDGKSAAA